MKKIIYYPVKRFMQTGDNCGAFSLAQVISFYDPNIDPGVVLKKTKKIENVGTWDANLGIAAIRLGYKAIITPMNNYAFDPCWINLSKAELTLNLEKRKKKVKNKLLKLNIGFFVDYLKIGGEIELRSISKDLLIKKLLKYPFLAGLSSNYLYKRKLNEEESYGFRSGHFIAINGYDFSKDEFFVTDSGRFTPFNNAGRYKIKSEELIASIYLGEATFDSTILELST